MMQLNQNYMLEQNNSKKEHFYKHNAITPVVTEHEQSYCTYRYVFDSRDRNHTLNPDDPDTDVGKQKLSEFTIKLDEPLRYIKSIQLLTINAQIDRRYLIHNYNRYLYYQPDSSSAKVEIKLDVGDYGLTTLGTNAPTDDTLIKHLKTKLDAASSSTTTINIDKITEKLLITGLPADSIISFRLEDTVIDNNYDHANPPNPLPRKQAPLNDSPAPILGFDTTKKYTATGGNITSPFRVSFVKNDYAVLSVFNLEINSAIQTTIIDSLAIIPRLKSSLPFKNDLPIIKHFKQYLSYFDKMIIKLTDYYGNPFDLNGGELMIELIFETKHHI